MSERLDGVAEINIGLGELRIPVVNPEKYGNEPTNYFKHLWELNEELQLEVAHPIVEGTGTALVAFNGSGGHLLLFRDPLENQFQFHMHSGEGPYATTPSSVAKIGDQLMSELPYMLSFVDFEGNESGVSQRQAERIHDSAWLFTSQVERRLRGLNSDPGYMQLEETIFRHFDGEANLDNDQTKRLRVYLYEVYSRFEQPDIEFAQQALFEQPVRAWKSNSGNDTAWVDGLCFVDILAKTTMFGGDQVMGDGSVALFLMQAQNSLRPPRQLHPKPEISELYGRTAISETAQP